MCCIGVQIEASGGSDLIIGSRILKHVIGTLRFQTNIPKPLHGSSIFYLTT